MTRTTDDLRDAERFKPLGTPIRKEKAPAAVPEWKQVPGAAKGVEQNRDGFLRTNIPTNGWIHIHIGYSGMKVTLDAIRRALKGIKCRP